MPPQIFKDAKGKTIEKKVQRNVNDKFEKKVVDKFLGLLTDLFGAKTNAFKPTVSPACTRSVIVLTSELTNAMRTGMPPSIPSYSRSSLWRNEGICLQQLSKPGESLGNLRLGMTWCEEKNSGESVDLDLSVILYDDQWTYIDNCSYSNLSIKGCEHSGDFTEVLFRFYSTPYTTWSSLTLRKHAP